MDRPKGIKHDAEKPPLDLIPYDALFEAANVLQFGKKKYGVEQWKGGIEYRRLIAASLRHILQFKEGENLDPESNLSHVAHACVNLMFLLWMIKNKPEMDDRV